MPQAIHDSGLSTYLHGTILRQAKENRRPAEEKWDRNRAAREADPSIDPKGTWKKDENAHKWKSDTMIDVTKQKCVAAQSMVRDQVLKTGVPYRLTMRDEGPKTDLEQTNPQLMLQIENSIEYSTALIDRQLDDCDAQKHVLLAVDSAIGYGRYWLHSYTREMVEQRYVEVEPGSGVYERATDVIDSKGVEWVPIREMYWDMENVHDPMNGEYIIRKQEKSPSFVQQKKGVPNFLPLQIDKALSRDVGTVDGASKATDDSETNNAVRELPNRRKSVEYVTFWAKVPNRIATDFEIQMATDQNLNVPGPAPTAGAEPDDYRNMVEVYVVTANGVVIGYAREPGKRPYFTDVWETSTDDGLGRGIPDNCECVQKVLNGMVRSMENNMKLTSSFLVAVARENAQENIEDVMGREGGVITIDPNAEGGARNAVQQINFRDTTGPLAKGIAMFMEFADLASNIPRAEQGQQSSNPQTAFELQQRLERSSKYISGGIKQIDNGIQWLITEFYEYNMENPEIVEGKGDFLVKATGFGSFDNRVIKLQKLMQYLSLISSDPDLRAKANIDWILESIAEAMDIEKDQAVKSKDQQAEEAQAKEQSEERLLQIALLEAEVAGKNAMAQKNEASARREEANIPIDAQKVENETAETVIKAEESVANRGQQAE